MELLIGDLEFRVNEYFLDSHFCGKEVEFSIR